MAWRDWLTDAWFRFRFETLPGLRCSLCEKWFEIGDLALAVPDLTDDGQDYAHVSCAERCRRCVCCKGRGVHAERDPGQWEGSVATGNLRPPRCTDCDGRGYRLQDLALAKAVQGT